MTPPKCQIIRTFSEDQRFQSKSLAPHLTTILQSYNSTLCHNFALVQGPINSPLWICSKPLTSLTSIPTVTHSFNFPSTHSAHCSQNDVSKVQFWKVPPLLKPCQGFHGLRDKKNGLTSLQDFLSSLSSVIWFHLAQWFQWTWYLESSSFSGIYGKVSKLNKKLTLKHKRNQISNLENIAWNFPKA